MVDTTKTICCNTSIGGVLCQQLCHARNAEKLLRQKEVTE